MMRIVEILEIAFPAGPFFHTVLPDLCFIIDYIVKVAAKPRIDKYERTFFTFLYAEISVQIYSKGIEVIIALSEIAEKLPRC